MSINYNRTAINNCTTRREYKIKRWSWKDDPYWDECRKFHNTKTPRYNSNWKRRKELTPFEVRTFKTWKHNRKTQWKYS